MRVVGKMLALVAMFIAIGGGSVSDVDSGRKLIALALCILIVAAAMLDVAPIPGP